MDLPTDPPPMADLRQRIRRPPARDPVHLPRDVNRAANTVVRLANPLQGGLGRLFYDFCLTFPGSIIMSLALLFVPYRVMFQRQSGSSPWFPNIPGHARRSPQLGYLQVLCPAVL